MKLVTFLQNRSRWIWLFALLLFPLTALNQLDPLTRHPAREDGTWRSLNNFNLIFLSSWRASGLVDSKLALIVPFDETDARFGKPYSSYPPTYLFPLLAAEKLSPQQKSLAEATYRRIDWLAAAGHFLLACLAGYIAISLSCHWLAVLSCIAATLFLPPLLSFQHNIWWPDMAGLLAAALFLLFHARAKSDSAIAAAATLGTLLEWFTPLLALCTFPFANRRRRLILAAAVALALALFLAQQQQLRGLMPLWYKARLRTGWDEQNFSFGWHLLAWLDTVKRFLGWGGLLLPPAVLAASALFREARSRLKALAPLYLAVLAHWLLFNQHYPGHHYNLVRWSFALALLPALFPKRFALPACILFLAWLGSIYPLFPASLEGSSTDLKPAELAACRLVERHHGPERLFVSTGFFYEHDFLGYLWYFPHCQSVVAKAQSEEEILLVMQKRFIRAGFAVAPIEKVFFLSRELRAPDWAPQAKEIDRENEWGLFELARPH